MVEAAIVFLLFFAVLTFAWFYLQRAKARAADATVEPADTGPTDPAP